MAKAPAKKAAVKKPAVKAPAKKSGSKKASEPRIVEGAGVGVPANPKQGSRAVEVERAMSAAIAKAVSEGISDPEEQRALMMAARDEVLKG